MCPQPRISFLVHEYLGSERPVSFEISAPRRLSLRGSHVRRKFWKRTTLRSESSTLIGLLYAGWRSRCEVFAARKGRTIAMERSVSEKAVVKDKQKSTFFTSWVSSLIPTWAVLRSLANARKLARGFLWEEVRNPRVLFQKHGGACTKYCAKKLVSSDFAKILNVKTKIRETCEKHCLLPLVQLKLLNSIVSV